MRTLFGRSRGQGKDRYLEGHVKNFGTPYLLNSLKYFSM